MPLSRATLNTVTCACAIAAAVVGWFSVSAPVQESGTLLEKIHASSSASQEASSAAAKLTATAAISEFERSLTDLIRPSSSPATFSGERLEELFSKTESDNPCQIHSGIFYAGRWAEQDPQEMFEWFCKRGSFSLPGARSYYSFSESLFPAWALKNSAAALQAALRWPATRERAGILGVIISTLRRSDPPRAAAIAAAQLPLLAAERQSFFSNTDDREPKDTWNFLTSLPPGQDRRTLLYQYFSELLKRSGDQSEQIWQQTPEVARRELVAAGLFSDYALQQIINYDRVVSLDGLAKTQRALIEETGDKNTAEGYLKWSGWSWAQKDLPAAIAWTQQHLKGRQRIGGTSALFGAAAATDFDAALRTWQTLPEGTLRAAALGNLAASAPPDRKSEAETLLESLSPADQQTARKAADYAKPMRDLHQSLEGL